MTEISETEFVLRVARVVVEEVAPEELVSFSLLAEIYIEEQENLLERRASATHQIGTGMGLGEMFTTTTWIILMAVSQGVLQGAKESINKQSESLFLKLFKRLGKHNHEKQKKPHSNLPARGKKLSPEELQMLQSFFYKTLLQQGLSDSKALQLANAIAIQWVIEPVNSVSTNKGQ